MSRQHDDYDDDGADMGQVSVLHVTDRAVLVRDGYNRQIWVPISCIHDNSEVYGGSGRDEGRLIVASWWAEKEGLA